MLDPYLPFLNDTNLTMNDNNTNVVIDSINYISTIEIDHLEIKFILQLAY